ncbi:protein-tyrosine-phosphatase [Flavobacterium galactosidilyticum]|uniref:protein-tyrosine-phosphatase n=1 Tax=Flavobacterium galactosidilyticum TaxID=2893886 RepID=UPI001E5EAB3B|nr:protein-tyrosine-phosphatase [Flavobacterium sp. F-340]UFH45156.1 protein-tyrosine-phosphatase [Flavobacterium sp. F-340]
MTTNKIKLFSKIESAILAFDFAKIAAERKTTLQSLIDFIQNKVNTKQTVLLNFICTHNSRRSHLAQVWAQTAATHYNIKNVFCYSGGTEATALYPTVLKTLEQSGFKIATIADGDNPIYSIKYTENEHPIIGFSKSYNDDFNPKNSFAAILTCAQADGDCPFISGAEKRIAIPFEDPKAFDSTWQQTEKYQDRSLQIATEIFYLFSQIKL